MAQSPLVRIALGYMPAQVLYAAAELRVADLLTEGPRSSDELAQETGMHAGSLLRLLRALVVLGVVAQTEPDRFELTELGGQLRSDTPDSVRSFVTMVCEPESWRSWGDLLSCLRTGDTAFDRIYGMPFFEYLGNHPDKATTFNAAMSDITRGMAPGIITGYDFSRFGTIVDVGGGEGTLISQILRAEPSLEGILFDLQSGLESATAILDATGVTDRCQIVPGDFFDSVPEGGDAYLVKAVLHDWDDEKAVAILRNCRNAMANDGRVLIIERVVPEWVTPAASEVVMVDLYMLVSPGGRERTEAEYRRLLAEAGFTLSAMTDPLPPIDACVIEGTPV